MITQRSVLLLLFLSSGYAYAECADDYKIIARDLYSEGRVQQYEPVCKVWPSTGLMIMATALDSEQGIDIGLALIDPKSKIVVVSRREVDMLSGTAIYNTGIAIDTADYRINGRDTAFGIRTSWQGSSKPNPYNSESLNLYILRDDKLQKILDDLNVYEYSGEWDTHCEGVFVDRKRILIMAPTSKSTNMILIKEEETREQSTPTSNGCETLKHWQPLKTHIINFVKGGYKVNDSLRSSAQR